MKRTGPTNPMTKEVVAQLRGTKANWAREVADTIEKSRRARPQVNISRINRYAKDETIVVPGKVLGSGAFDKKVTVAALEFSGAAREKISRSGKAVTITELVKSNPKKVRVFK